MRVVLLWIALGVSGGVFLTMMLATHRSRKDGTLPARPSAVAEYAWTSVPWLILALGAAPAVYRVLSAAG